MSDKQHISPEKVGSRDERPPPSQVDDMETSEDKSTGQVSANIEQSGSASTSSPIEIIPAASGKFGVLQVRPPAPSESMTDSNGEPVPIDKLIKTANTMSSMMMAHKIALEDDFKLEPGMDISGPLMNLSPIIGSSPSKDGAGLRGSGEPNLHSRVKDIVLDAFWDLFKDELKSQTNENKEERKYDQSKQLLCDIKQKILELLLPQHARLKQDIEDRLDPQIVDQLAKQDSLDLIDYGHYILGVLAKLCASVRDEKLKDLSGQRDVVQLYRGIMELLELMRLDMANFTLNRFKPHIKAHSQDYERDKFNEILKQQKNIGIDGLEYTRIWLARAIKKVDDIYGVADLVLQEEPTPNPIGILEESSSSEGLSKTNRILKSDVVNKVLNVAYCELLEWNPQSQKLYPETLLFDEATFRSLGEQYKVLLVTSSILLTTFAFLNRFKLNENNEFKVLIKSHIITLLTATYDRTTATATSESCISDQASAGAIKPIDPMDQVKLETVATKLCEDIRQKLDETNKTLVESFCSERELLKRQILDLQSSSNRVKELVRRRILEFVETLLDLDAKHQQRKFPSKMPPPVNIPLGLNCLTDEITLTMAQLVKIIRYNRRVFFQHYENIIVELVLKMI